MPRTPPTAADHDGLDEELERMSRRARADRLAQADLARPLGHRDQHDVHDPDAADEQRDGRDRRRAEATWSGWLEESAAWMSAMLRIWNASCAATAGPGGAASISSGSPLCAVSIWDASATSMSMVVHVVLPEQPVHGRGQTGMTMTSSWSRKPVAPFRAGPR